MKSFTVYNGGVKLYFGLETVVKTRKYLEHYSRLLVVTGRSSAKVSGALGEAEKILREANVDYEVWGRAEPNPTDKHVEELVAFYREGLFEGFIAIGGGSVIDLAKAARTVVSGGGVIKDYLYGLRKPSEKQPFLLVVNLTHGTGSEIDRFSVITITETREKIGFAPGYPNISVDDPRYTVTLPRDQTIYVSMDAFSHAVESATSTYSSPYTVLLAGETIENIVEYLPRALEQPSNVEYRYWLLYASMIAGIAIDHGVTHIGHFIEHLLTGYNSKLPHGAGLAILYRELLKYIYEAEPETMAKILKPIDQSLKPSKESSSRAARSYTEFLEAIGFDETLSSYGFSLDDVNHIVNMYGEQVEKKNISSPVKLTPQQVREILVKLL